MNAYLRVAIVIGLTLIVVGTTAGLGYLCLWLEHREAMRSLRDGGQP